MTRPGFVLTVDERTPPLLVPNGDRLSLMRLAAGTEVLYPPDSLPGLEVGRAIEEVAQSPMLGADGSSDDPLAARLRAGMRLTIVFADDSVPLPRMRQRDLRGQIAEQVLSAAAASGVDDVALIAGTGGRRRMSAPEISACLGERISRSFAGGPDAQITSHDAADQSQLEQLGTFSDGTLIQINARVAASDLVVYLNLQTDPSPTGGWDQFAQSVAGMSTLRHRLGFAQTQAGGSAAAELVTAVSRLPVISIGAAINNVAPNISALGKREWDWKLRDRVGLASSRRLHRLTPQVSRHARVRGATAGYQLLELAAGNPDQVTAVIGEVLRRRYRVPHPGQVGTAILGVGAYSPHSVDRVPDALVAAATAAEALTRYEGTPLLASSGSLIIVNPALPARAGRTHPATPDFISDVLSATLDPAEISQQYEDAFAAEDWYRELYRSAHAYPGLQPFWLWYSLEPLRRLASVVWVGGHRETVRKLGFRAASTLEDALEMVAISAPNNSLPTAYLHHRYPLALVT